MNIYAILSLLGTVFIFALGVFLYFKSARSNNAILFLLLSIAVSLLNLSQFQMRIATNADNAFLWSKLYSIWPIALAFSLHFVSELNRKVRRSALFYFVTYSPAFFLTYIQFSTTSFALPPVEKYWGWSIVYKPGAIYIIALIITLTYWFSTLTILYRYSKKQSGKLKKQARLIFIGFLLYFIGDSSTDLIFQQYELDIPEFANIFGVITFIFVGYGIWHYDIFVIKQDTLSNKLFSSFSNYLILVDGNNTIIEINSSLLKLLHYSREEVIGNNLSHIIKDSSNEQNPLAKQVKLTSEFANQQIHFCTRENNIEKLFFTASRVKISDGSKSGLIYIGTEQNIQLSNQNNHYQNEKNTRFLAEAALDMFLFKKKEDVYHYVTEHIYSLLNKEAIVACAVFDKESDNLEWNIKSITGINTNFQDLTRLLGFDPMSMKSNSTKNYNNKIREGKLTQLDLDFNKLTNGLIPQNIGEKVMTLLGIKDLHVISIKHSRNAFGTIAILRKAWTPKINKELIESFIAIASLVQNRLDAEYELAESEKLFRSLVEGSKKEKE